MMRSAARTLVRSRTAAVRGYATRGKDILFGQDARENMLRGVENLTRAVAVTMGPGGRNVIMEQGFGGPKISKDGVTVAKSIEFADKYENLGAQLVRQVANTTNDIAGDGTTTATVLACSIFREGFKCVTTGANPTDIKRGIDMAVRHVVEKLNGMAKRITTNEDIRNVATISANGDKEVGKLLADALAKLGPNGTITTQDGKTLNTEIEVVEGMSIDRGYISPHFVTNTKQQKVEFENALVLVHQKKISSINNILPVLNHIAQQNKPLLIIADDVDGEALSTLIINKTMGKIRVAAVKAPSFGDEKNNCLMDIAIMTGAQFISDDVGLTLDQHNFDPACLGTVQKVTITKDSSILLGGGGKKEALKERVDLLNSMLELETSDYKREKITERLSKLSGGVAVIKVGGASDVEVNEKKDRITDALCATRAAIEEGILPGGGVALLRASASLMDLEKSIAMEDQRTGVQIVRQALRLPARTIAENAGMEGSVVTEKILQHQEVNIGYDAVTHQYRDMVAAGILDPLKVVKSALIDASSVASLMLTTEAAVVASVEEEEQ